jgi:hypothetical protein
MHSFLETRADRALGGEEPVQTFVDRLEPGVGLFPLRAKGRTAWHFARSDQIDWRSAHAALVHDRYGRAHVCMRPQRFAIHRCAAPSFNDGDYRATFAGANHSSFTAVALSSNPLRLVNVVPITIGGSYIKCGSGPWLAITNAPAGLGEAVYSLSSLSRPA